jgi:hypothetical protein
MVETIEFSVLTIGTGQEDNGHDGVDWGVFEGVDTKSEYGNCCSSKITCLDTNILIVGT